MKTTRVRSAFCYTSLPVLATALALATPCAVRAASPSKNPASKMYVADVSGDAIIDTGESLEDLTKRSVYTAQGTIIETKKPDSDSDRAKHFSTMVYSNGTGAFFDADTRVEVKRFMQEPFTPNRNDMEVEPSISQTQAFLSRGTVGLCNSKLVAGSNMTYQTPLGSVNVAGRKVVIEAQNDVTKISMLEGDSTVKAGSQDLGGHLLRTGEQAVITKGAAGQPNQVVIQKIPSTEMPNLDDKVAMACMAKKTVYFEVREKSVTNTNAVTPGGQSATGEGESKSGDGSGGITAFDGNSGGTSSTTVREIVPVETVPVTLPTEHTVSASRLPSQ